MRKILKPKRVKARDKKRLQEIFPKWFRRRMDLNANPWNGGTG